MRVCVFIQDMLSGVELEYRKVEAKVTRFITHLVSKLKHNDATCNDINTKMLKAVMAQCHGAVRGGGGQHLYQ